MPHNAGKPFEHEISRSLSAFEEQYPIWQRRIPDFRSWIKYNPKLIKPKVPADFEALFRGIFYLLEAKSTKSRKYYQMRWIKEHQKKSLLDAEKCGGRGYILFSRRGQPVICRAIRIQEYLDLEQDFKDIGRKSIDVPEMEKAGIECPRLRNSFDLSPIFLNETPPARIRGIRRV